MRRSAEMLLLLAALAALWQLAHLYAGEAALSSPAAAAMRAAELLGSGRFWLHARETGIALAYAFLIAAAGGIALGLLLGLHRTSGAVAEPILVSLYSLPKITLYPVILLLFGLGLPAKVAFGAIHGIVPVTLFALNGVRAVKPVYFKAARAMRLPPRTLVTGIVLPAALPEIATGIRVGFCLTVLGVLIGEMFASQRGLGFLIMTAAGQSDMPTLLAVALMLAAAAVAANALLLRLDALLHARA